MDIPHSRIEDSILSRRQLSPVSQRNPIEVPASYRVDTDKLLRTFLWRLRAANTMLKSKAGELRLRDFEASVLQSSRQSSSGGGTGERLINKTK